MIKGKVLHPFAFPTRTARNGTSDVENGSVKPSETEPRRRRPTNFGIVPLPKRLVYDPEHPAHFGLLLNVVFGLSSTFRMSSKLYSRAERLIGDDNKL